MKPPVSSIRHGIWNNIPIYVLPASILSANGITEKRRPNALSSRSWYETKHPEVAASGLDPALHYVRQGSAKGFDPHPLFDSRFYLANQSGVAREDALTDFLHQRHAGNLVPSMRLPSPPETIRPYPEAFQNRIRVSPILTGLPTIHYLSAHLRTGNEPDNGPRTLADFVEPERNPLHQIGGSLRQSDIGVIVEWSV